MNRTPAGGLDGPASALLGGAAWTVMVAGAAAGRFALDIIALLFLLAPLVVVPLGLDVLRRRAGGKLALVDRAAHILQPLAAALVVASFFVPPGRTAALLAAGWLVLCGLVGLSGAARFLRGGYRSLEQACFAVGPMYLLVGGVWLALSRLGATPAGFAEPIVLLTGVHFHYTGFALPLVAGATGQTLGTASRGAKSAFRLVALGILAGPAVLAAGFVLSPVLKVCAAVVLAAATIGLAGLLVVVLPRVHSQLAKALLLVSAGSLGVAMVLAGVYALGEYAERYWLLIPQMARFHGVANGLGFALCGLLAWTLESRLRGGTSGDQR